MFKNYTYQREEVTYNGPEDENNEEETAEAETWTVYGDDPVYDPNYYDNYNSFPEPLCKTINRKSKKYWSLAKFMFAEQMISNKVIKEDHEYIWEHLSELTKSRYYDKAKRIYYFIGYSA